VKAAKPTKPTLWSRFSSWLRRPLDLGLGLPEEMATWLKAARAFAEREGRHHVSIDDLFLSLGHDEDLVAFLQSHGTSLDDVVDDVRLVLESTDATLDRSGDRAVVAACVQAWVGLQSGSETSESLALFHACLRPGVPSFVRESFERRTGLSLRDLRWRQAHGEVTDTDATTRRAYVVVYNDPFTTQEFVEHAFRTHAHLTPADAHALMLAVHRFGVAIIAEGLTVEMAKIKKAIVDDARATVGAPLRVRVEPIVDHVDHVDLGVGADPDEGD